LLSSYFEHHPPCCNGIRLSLVVGQVDAEVGGEGVELVVGEVGPGLAGELQGALVGKGGRGQLVVVQQGVEHAEIEWGVVGDDEIGGGEVGEDLMGDLTELGLVSHIEPRETVDVLGPLLNEPAVACGRFDEPVGRFDEIPFLKHSNTQGTGAEGAAVGGFKIEGDDFHEIQAAKPMARWGLGAGGSSAKISARV